MLSPVPAPDITLGRSRRALRTDKKRHPLAWRSRSRGPDVAARTSPLCDALPQPAGQAVEDGYLVN